jgi:hypothetical protein
METLKVYRSKCNLQNRDTRVQADEYRRPAYYVIRGGLVRRKEPITRASSGEVR